MMNMRSLLSVHKLEGTLTSVVNDALFGISFILSRIVLYPIILYRVVYGLSLLPQGFPLWRLALSYFVITLFVAMYAI